MPHVDTCESFPLSDQLTAGLLQLALMTSLAEGSKANECGFHLLHLSLPVKASFLATRTSALVESMAFTVTSPHHVQSWYESGYTLW